MRFVILSVKTVHEMFKKPFFLRLLKAIKQSPSSEEAVHPFNFLEKSTHSICTLAVQHVNLACITNI